MRLLVIGVFRLSTLEENEKKKLLLLLLLLNQKACKKQ